MSRHWRSESGPYAGPDRSGRQSRPSQGDGPRHLRVPPFLPPVAGDAGRTDHSPPDPWRHVGADSASPACRSDPAYEEWGTAAGTSVEPRASAPPPAAPAPPDTDARESVATALETVALRVRTGELEPRGFEPGMSDAAAVATALTALLTAPT